MPSFKPAVVRLISVERPGLQRVFVERLDGSAEQAYVLTEVIGPVAVGDEVIINTTAVDLGLGTGGAHVVHWNLSRSEWAAVGQGHIMKARYTSVQVDGGAYEEGAGYVEPESLSGMQVIICLLHSQVAAVAVAIKHARPSARVGYVMSDEASLPYAISDLAYELRSKSMLDVSISAGQAFGADFEAVNVTSGLGIAKSLGADVVIVGPGPGVVGTGTKLGFGALASAAHIDAATAYGAQAILALRYSDADSRERHQGLSHHSQTVLEMCNVKPLTATPVNVDVPNMAELFSAIGIEVKTMGRDVSEDQGFFQYAGAAGILAAQSL